MVRQGHREWRGVSKNLLRPHLLKREPPLDMDTLGTVLLVHEPWRAQPHLNHSKH